MRNSTCKGAEVPREEKVWFSRGTTKWEPQGVRRGQVTSDFWGVDWLCCVGQVT